MASQLAVRLLGQPEHARFRKRGAHRYRDGARPPELYSAGARAQRRRTGPAASDLAIRASRRLPERHLEPVCRHLPAARVVPALKEAAVDQCGNGVSCAGRHHGQTRTVDRAPVSHQLPNLG
jgi:hypothetical protein